MENKKFWKPVHTKWLIAIAIIVSAYGGLRKYYMDEFTLGGVRISKINNSTLNNGDTSIPTSQSVYNAILAASFDPSSGLTNWLDITNPTYGGVANGGYNTGTDNTPAFNAAYAAAPNNGVIYIPPGSYRFYETIRMNTTGKRVFIVSYGDLYFGTDTAFIFDGAYSKYWLNGALFGTNQFSGSPNYGAQTNPGIYLRNAYNNEVFTNTISGFKYAIKVGGNGGGNQYNKIAFNRLWINSVGIQIAAEGTTANGPRWSNENVYNGSQITADTGIVFQKDATPGDIFNGNKFYNIGFEFRGNNEPMRVGIKGDWAANNVFFSGRIESTGVTTKFQCTGDVNGMQFYGWLMRDSWLNNLGYGAVVMGAIYGNNGDILGNQAYGYTYSATNTYQNGRFRLYGLRWGFSAAAALSSNIDIVWAVDVDITTTASTYAFTNGITFAKINYAGGTNTTTLPDAATRANEMVTVKNIHGSNTVTVSGAAAGSVTSIPAYGCVVYYSDGNVWYDIANNFNSGGGGGSSQWIDDGVNIRYPNRVKIFGTTATASMHIGYRNTPTIAGSGGFKLDGGTLLLTPENGLLENDLFDWWITTQNTRQKIITTGNINTVTFAGGSIAVVNDANYTVVDGVNTVLYSASTGTKIVTLPAAASYLNRELKIRNSGSSAISIPAGYWATAGSSTTTLAAGIGILIKSDGTKWWLIY